MIERRANRGATVSTVLGRRLGGELLRLRENRNLKQPHAAEALSASVAKIAKMERGLVPMRDPDIRALCHLYGVEDEVRIQYLLRLARADRERRRAKGWWDQYPQLASMSEYFALEDVAEEIRTWEHSFIPGLLQTPEYARALAVGNHHWEDVGEIEPFVEARMARQKRLAGPGALRLRAVVHEAALRQLVGGREVMRRQLTHLLEVMDQERAQLQVLPFSAGAHPGMTNAFTILSFAEPGALDVVRTDTLSVKLWLESETDSVHHVSAFERITRAGLAPRGSAELIRSIHEEL
ncbi:helix-turn-helix domain-containing protein [Streptomyces alkaliphilus]|uniref:helix-turn-helix domain-containing protein n=1 Tax=Streptomyces alkaliphilus TaxID=1472722 RepID=UPI001180D552|nr:helix-turn-helix transcriptional regulator [Streptomyces alkaliphilus]MQS07252.1 helix-turn-helix domain-containing protein [Streptomyces alkaliphilus]